jgi:SecY interacting protein Syd
MLIIPKNDYKVLNYMQSQWQKFVERYAQSVKLSTQYDPEWPSACLIDDVSTLTEGDVVTWSPVARPLNAMTEFTDALGITLPPSLNDFYTAFYADHLTVNLAQGDISLLQAWNADDFARWQENLIGHVLMKRRLKQAETLFIGLPSNDDYLISVLLSTGEVVLEPVGKPPQDIIASDMNQFIALCHDSIS